MKKFKLLIILIMIFIGINKVSATGNIYDYANVLNDGEEFILNSSIDDYINKYNIDMMIVTTNSYEQDSIEEYTKYFYSNLNKDDVIIFTLDTNTSDIYILLHGKGETLYKDKLNNIYNIINSEKKNGYYFMFNKFIYESSNYDMYDGINKNITLARHTYRRYSKSKSLIMSIIISLVITGITILILINKNKMVRKSRSANYYVKEGSVVINKKSDTFITSHTDSQRINNSSNKK